MFLLDIKMKKRKVHKTVMVYIGVVLFSVLFSMIYLHYSHGVNSNYMTYLFLFPLIGGVIPYGVIGLIGKLQFPNRISLNIYNSGIATLTLGSCLKGILEIYGTSSNYIAVYWIVGIVLTLLGAIIYFRTIIKETSV